MLFIRIDHGVEQPFIYGVKCAKHIQPSYVSDAVETLDNSEQHSYYRAEVHLAEGGQNYDIMGWSEQAVINDVIDQYQKHMHFLHLLR